MESEARPIESDPRGRPGHESREPGPPEPASLLSPAPEAEAMARGQASAEALRELAMALRSSVETMHGVRDLQAELVTTLKRQDRSELVLQSTNALNDTFRSLARTQRELVKRLEESSGRGGAAAGGGIGRLLPLMMLGLLIVFLGGIYVVIDVLEGMKAERPDVAALVQETTAHTLAAYEAGKEEGAGDAERTVAQLEEELAQWEARERAMRQRLDEEKDSKEASTAEFRAAQARVEALTSQLRAAQNEMLARRAVEEELRDVNSKLAVAEPKLRDLEIELQREKSETARLRRRLGEQAMGIVPEAPVEAAPPAPAPVTPPARSNVERDPMLLNKIRARLNQMLDASSRGRAEMWQITEIAGVTDDRLDGLTVHRYDRRTGRLVEQVDAREARIWVDRNQRSVELELDRGPQGFARPVVANGEMTRLWSQSGLLFLQFR